MVALCCCGVSQTMVIRFKLMSTPRGNTGYWRSTENLYSNRALEGVCPVYRAWVQTNPCWVEARAVIKHLVDVVVSDEPLLG